MKKPNSWQEVPFGELADFYDHKRIPLSSRERASRKGPYPYYGASGVIDQVDQYIFDGSYLLISEDGENLNSRKSPIAFRANGRFWVNNHAHIVRGKANIAHDRFLEYLFAVANISGAITGAAQPKLSQANLKAIKFRIPNYTTQASILAVLGAYDDLIENNTRRIKILEEMAQMLYREWFVNFRFPGHEKVRMVESELGPIPRSWAVSDFGALSVNLDSRRIPLSSMQRASHERLYPYYGASGVIDSVESFLFDGQHLLISEDGENLRSRKTPIAFLADGKFWVNNHAHVVQGRSPVSTVYLFACFANVDIAPYLTGTAQPKLSQANMNRIPMLRPDPDTLQCFDAMYSPFLQGSDILKRRNTNLRTARDLLLPKLISGEVPVECADETAAELMEATA